VPAAYGGGQENLTARGQKISGEIKTPKTPPFFARSPEKFTQNDFKKLIKGAKIQ